MNEKKEKYEFEQEILLQALSSEVFRLRKRIKKIEQAIFGEDNQKGFIESYSEALANHIRDSIKD
jgi:hypothetical protein